MIKDFSGFIDESYLDSNHGPLYHYTTTYQFIDILESNTLKVSQFESPVKGKKEKVKIVSLTRNKDFDFSYYKPYLDVIIELDKNELLKKYKILPYDYFIQSGRDDKTKSNPDRKFFEFEEIILTDIINIDKYILSVNFRNDSIFSNPVAKILPILKNKNIKIYVDGKKY